MNLRLLPTMILVALRNLWLHKVRTLIVAGILTFGTFLIVFGFDILTNMNRSMSESIINTIAGNIQVYPKNGKDELALFGGATMSIDDIGFFSEYEKIQAVIQKHPNVKSSIPMGIDYGMLSRGTEMDDQLDAFRAALKRADPKEIESQVQLIKSSIATIREQSEKELMLQAETEETRKQKEAIAVVSSEDFWKDFSSKIEEKLQYLETRVSPHSGEKPLLYTRYIGTNIEEFTNSFEKFKLLEGTLPPKGHRGIILGNAEREFQLKNVVARGFDFIKRARSKQNLTIAKDTASRTWARDMSKQSTQVLLTIKPDAKFPMRNAIAAFLKKEEPKSDDIDASLRELMKEFLTVDDANFDVRYDFFYKEIAPNIRLYDYNVGDYYTLRVYTRSGYLKTISLKIYGVYTFAGLDSTDFAGAFNIMDLVSFRELYGKMSAASLAETEALRKELNLKEVTRENAEEDLFGSNSSPSVEVTSAPKTIKTPEPLITAMKKPSDLFEPDEERKGLALNFAVLLKNPQALEATQKELEASLKEAHLDANVVDWKKASGFLGQFVGAVGGILVLAVTVIFIVALVIINNSMIMATMDRTREIGTMRAIGASKGFVLNMFVVETLVLCALGVGLGTLMAGGALLWAQKVGIPASIDILVFLFSGPRLHPTIFPSLFLLAPVIIIGISLIATLYPAFLAARVNPSVAMQEKE